MITITTTGVVIKIQPANKPYKYIKGEERKIEGTQGNTPNKIKTLRQLVKITGKNWKLNQLNSGFKRLF